MFVGNRGQKQEQVVDRGGLDELEAAVAVGDEVLRGKLLQEQDVRVDGERVVEMRQRDVHQGQRRGARHLVDVARRNGDVHLANPADERRQGVGQKDAALRIRGRVVVELVAGVAEICELEGGKPLGTCVDVQVVELAQPVEEGEPNVFPSL